MENKKISFGFSKITKKAEKKPVQNKSVEFIDCLEGQSIKIIGSENNTKVKEPLVIALRDDAKNLFDRVKNARQKNISKAPEIKNEDIKLEIKDKPDSELSIDELAAKELLKEAQNRDATTSGPTTKIESLPIAEDKFVADGEEESTLEDYDSVPINDFGMAMLRGMGWKEGQAIGKNPNKTVPILDPELRPRGLGLGADKLVKLEKKPDTVDKNGKELVLVKGAYAKIIAGNHIGEYCQVEGLDDQSCRIIVKTAKQNMILSLQEFLVIPVTKEEYAVGSKVINNAKYEEYKLKSENKQNYNTHSDKNERNYSNTSDSETEHYRKERSRSERSPDRKKYSSDDSSDSDRDSRKKEKKKSSRDHRRSRDRSPSHHKHKSSKKKKSKSKRRSRSKDRSRHRR